jgi:hypothetical protein
VEENDDAQEIEVQVTVHINLQDLNSHQLTAMGFVDRFSLTLNLILAKPLNLNLAKPVNLNLAKPQRITHERHCR